MIASELWYTVALHCYDGRETQSLTCTLCLVVGKNALNFSRQFSGVLEMNKNVFADIQGGHWNPGMTQCALGLTYESQVRKN